MHNLKLIFPTINAISIKTGINRSKIYHWTDQNLKTTPSLSDLNKISSSIKIDPADLIKKNDKFFTYERKQQFFEIKDLNKLFIYNFRKFVRENNIRRKDIEYEYNNYNITFSVSTYYRFLNSNYSGNIQLRNLDQIAKAFNIEPSTLLIRKD